MIDEQEKLLRMQRVDDAFEQILRIKELRGYNNSQLRRAMGVNYATLERILSRSYKNLLHLPIIERLEVFIGQEAESRVKARKMLAKTLEMDTNDLGTTLELIDKVKASISKNMDELRGRGTQQAGDMMFYLREIL